MRPSPTNHAAVGAKLLLVAIIAGLLPQPVGAEDWPMWRFDGRRSAASTEGLADELHLQWSAALPQPRPAWPEDPRLHFDATLEPIVAGKTLMVTSNRNDSLTAIHTETGELQWRFFADAPIRFAPIAVDGRVYFGADDGNFYCLRVEDGTVVWKFRAAPSDRLVIGNERITSAWPIRGGAVVSGGRLYFTCGIWPFEGTQLFSVALGGDEPALPRPVMLPDKVTPQGYLAADGDRVFIPSGRDVAGSFDTRSGKFVGLSYQSRGKTDYHVTAEGDYLLHGDRIYDIRAGKLLPTEIHRPISTRTMVVGTWKGSLVAYDLADPQMIEKTDRKGGKYFDKALKPLWSVGRESLVGGSQQPQVPENNPLSVELVAGNKIFGIHADAVFSAKLAQENAAPTIAWTAHVDGNPTRLIAADKRLFVATREGWIHCYGAAKVDNPIVHSPRQASSESNELAERVTGWIGANQDKGGYCLVVGAAESIVAELVRQSDMHVLVLDPDVERIDELRRHFDAERLYGTRVSALVGTPPSAGLPPYVMSLVICPSANDGATDPEVIDHVYRCLRPYGGRAIFDVVADSETRLKSRIQEARLPRAEVRTNNGNTIITRTGALPGAADWTHEYGDPSNSLMSRDELVKAPLGVLWFGGPAAASDLFFNRHFWPPSLTVNQGRMFFQGPEVFVAADIYTGRVLWRKKLAKGSSPGRRGNFFERVQVGFHFLAAEDAIYLSDGKQCEKIHPATGTTQTTFQLDRPDARWGTMRLWQDRLICTVFLPDEKKEYQPAEIVCLDRNTGREVWRHKAEFTVPVAALGSNEVFFYDGVLEGLYDAWKRRGLVPKSGETGYLKALDIRTGEQIWKSGTSRAVTWLGASSSNGVLVASNKKGMEAWNAETGALLWDKDQDGKGFLGHPEELWDKVILWNDRIIDQRGPGLAYDVKTGKQLTKAHPLSGEEVPWEFTKTGHHCNYAIASPHLLTFRADTAGFLDLESGTTGRLNGFRSGCRNSLIPAGGVLNAPNFAYGCVCSYSLFTSLALVHTPDADVWTYNAYQAPTDTIDRVGINLGAPGDRQDKTGTLWLEHPSVGGPSPKVAVTVTGDTVTYFRGHSLTVKDGDLPWVAASGCEGLTGLSIRLGKAAAERKCCVKLYFLEPGNVTDGQRVFDVLLQGKLVLPQFDVHQAAGGSRRVVVQRFDNVSILDTVDVELTPHSGKTLLCGIEIELTEKGPPR